MKILFGASLGTKQGNKLVQMIQYDHLPHFDVFCRNTLYILLGISDGMDSSKILGRNMLCDAWHDLVQNILKITRHAFQKVMERVSPRCI